VEGNGQATSTNYIHTDHLGGTNVVTDENGDVVQTLDYYPFGERRVNSGTDVSQKEYTGYDFDEESDLHYAGARYYDQDIGKFISQDPVFQNIGIDPRTGAVLNDPQLANAYSYARNNPIILTDDNGEFVQVAIGAGAGIVGQYGFDVYNNISTNGFSTDAFYSGLSSGETYLTRAVQGAVIGATGGAAGALTASVAGQAAIVGGASGIVGAGGNAYLGESITPQSVFFDTAIGALTFGLGSAVPKVPGRLPNFGTNAFFFGKHTQQSAQQLGVEAISSYMGALFGGASLGGGLQTYTTPSGAVVDSGGGLISGPSSEEQN